MRSALVEWVMSQEVWVLVVLGVVAVNVVRLVFVFLEEWVTRVAWFGVRPARRGRVWWF